MAYDCRDVAIILRQLKFKKSQSTFHNERKQFSTDVRSRKPKERQNQIMKFKASGNVHYVYMASLIFDVIGRL